MQTISADDSLSAPPRRMSLAQIPAIDGLRGIAAVSVAMYHFIRIDPTHSSFRYHLDIATSTVWSGVDLFFVISGFLITRILLHTKSNPHYFKTFYIRRTLRILPLYYAVIVTIFIILPLFSIHPAAPFQKDWPFFFTYTSNFLGLVRGEIGPVYTTHFWTLAIEEQFYLVWPLLIFVSTPRVLAFLFPSLLVLGVMLRWILVDLAGIGDHVRSIPFTHADGLLIGGWIAFFIWRGWKVTLPSLPVQIVLLLISTIFFGVLSLGVFGISPQPDWWNGAEYALLLLMITLVFVLMLFFAIGQRNFVQNALSHRLLRWLGKYSYAIYVLHVPIMILVVRLDVGAFLHGIGIGVGSIVDVAYLSLMLAMTLTAAVLSWYLLEKPFLQLKRFFPYA